MTHPSDPSRSRPHDERHLDLPDPSGQPVPATNGTEPGSAERGLPPAARRALAEAEARRAETDARAAAIARAPEIDGRGGLEPVRYEDWEIKGRAVDF